MMVCCQLNYPQEQARTLKRMVPVENMENRQLPTGEGPHGRQDRDAGVPGGKLQARHKAAVVQRVACVST